MANNDPFGEYYDGFSGVSFGNEYLSGSKTSGGNLPAHSGVKAAASDEQDKAELIKFVVALPSAGKDTKYLVAVKFRDNSRRPIDTILKIAEKEAMRSEASMRLPCGSNKGLRMLMGTEPNLPPF